MRRYRMKRGGIRYEIDDKKLLFDAGYSDIMIRNAHSLGVDLKKITHIVLSHGHDDHSVGLSLLFLDRPAPTFLLAKFLFSDLPVWQKLCHVRMESFVMAWLY